MLRFFRKIRSALIPESRFGRYFFYALGEIVLVVIGILIALQVNNWNQNRKERITEKNLLTQLVGGLRNDSSALSFNYKIHDIAAKSCDIILNAINNNLEYNDSLAFHFSAANYYTTFNPNQGGYESLKSIGLEIISNESLRLKIIKLYDGSYVRYNKNLDFLTELIFLLRNEFYPGLFNQFNIFDIKERGYKGEMIPLDFELLKQNSEYIYHINTLLNNHAINNATINEWTLSEVESLIKECLVEIEVLD